MLIRGTSTLRNLENYRKLMGKKQDTYLKSYGAFLKVCWPLGSLSPSSYGSMYVSQLISPRCTVRLISR